MLISDRPEKDLLLHPETQEAPDVLKASEAPFGVDVRLIPTHVEVLRLMPGRITS